VSLALVVVLLVAHQVDSIWGPMLKLVVVLVLISLMAKQMSYSGIPAGTAATLQGKPLP
jgi:hypothetical protein